MEPLLRVVNLSKSFGTLPVIQQVSFEIQPGEVVGLTGSIGSGKSVLVMPGGRAGLLACKLRRDPSLEQIWRGGWRVLKFRHLRRLAETSGLTRERGARELSADPIEPPEQMKLF